MRPLRLKICRGKRKIGKSKKKKKEETPPLGLLLNAAVWQNEAEPRLCML